MSKTMIAGAVTAAALAVGGGAFAATQLGSDADEQAILNDAASRLGVEPAELSDALEAAFAARIDAAVAAGELTQEQGAEMKQRLQENGLPLFGPRGGPHHGPGRGPGLEAAATYLGLTRDELHDALENGDTLAEVATKQGKSVDGLKQAMIADATEHLNAAVSDGRLTEEQKQQILEDLPERIDDIVNGTLPLRGPGHDHDGDGPPDGGDDGASTGTSA